MPKAAGQGFLRSAEIVLRRAGKPLNCAEIIERAVEAGLLESRGKTPVNTLYSLLNRHAAASKGSSCPIKKVGSGLFAIRR